RPPLRGAPKASWRLNLLLPYALPVGAAEVWVMRRKRVAILGSTGSIGTQALDVIARHADRFEVVALAAGKQVEKLREQTAQFNVRVAVSAEDGAAGLHRVAVESEPDIVLAATDGFVSFDAVFAAVERGIDIAVANKELI